MNKNTLTPEQENILKYKHTEAPFSGAYDDFYQKGTYICGWCNNPLYQSETKFDAGCGWPAFDDEIPGAVIREGDKHPIFGTEIVCAHCHGHLGHVYDGEHFTEKDVRHCANSLALQFIPEGKPLPEIADK